MRGKSVKSTNLVKKIYEEAESYAIKETSLGV